MDIVKLVEKTPTMEDLRDDLKRIAEARIFFAHQSVGGDVVKGLQDLAEEQGVPLRISETDRPGPGGIPIFCHTRIGRNRDPASKFEHFARLLRDGIGQDVQIAMFKLCYVDVTVTCDSGALSDRYLRVFDDLENTYPRLKLVHCTVPLTARRRGLKTALARAMGRSDSAMADNRVRTIFNDVLRARYGCHAGLFDLAYVETGRDKYHRIQTGTEAEIPALNPAYTDDGGHLNRHGRRIVSEELVRTLARILR